MLKNKILGILLCSNCFNPPPIEGTSFETFYETGEVGTMDTDSIYGTFGTTFITLTSTNGELSTETTATIYDLPLTTSTGNISTETSETTVSSTTELNSTGEFETGSSTNEIICGNGIIDDNEECDDGNRFDEDDCSSECYLPRIVFLTNNFNGKNDFGGINIADSICQNEAIQFNINGIFKAWLSDDNPNNDPFVRFNSTNYQGWYKLPSINGEQELLIAKGWDGLTSPLLNPINVTSAGTKDMNAVRAWTATKPDGKRVLNVSTCSSWQSLADNQTIVGNPQAVSNYWTEGNGAQCSGMVGVGKLYCFQID